MELITTDKLKISLYMAVWRSALTEVVVEEEMFEVQITEVKTEKDSGAKEGQELTRITEDQEKVPTKVTSPILTKVDKTVTTEVVTEMVDVLL
jgi:hypothetical protein